MADLLSRPTDARRRAAILFLDVVGYTGMLARDEDGTHALWSRFLAREVRPAVAGADPVKTYGDGVLAAFPRLDDAVCAARRLQRMLAEDHRSDRAEYPGLRLRMGLNVAPVLFEQGDVFGDGVNLARRLQESAAPGAIILSESARAALDLGGDEQAHDLGFIVLKGMPAPVRAFELVATGETPFGLDRPETELPSIAVLPFENLGAKAEDAYFADGLVEDVVASLAGLREMLVISRGSTLSFRDRRLDPKEARRVFGVRYVMLGAVRRFGETIRLSAALVDCETGVTLFSTRRDVGESELFREQDRLVEEIVAHTAPHVRQAELERALRKPGVVFNAYDLYLRALEAMRRLDRGAYEDAGKLLGMARATDPTFSMAFALSAGWSCIMVAQGWRPRDAEMIDAAAAFARRAVELDPSSALALATRGQIKSFLQGRHLEALADFEAARRCGPCHAAAWMLSAGGMAYVGLGAEAVAFAEHALRLAPFGQIIFTQYDWMSLACYSAGHYEDAALWARRALEDQPSHKPSLRLLAAAASATGDARGAEEARDRLLALDPGFRLARYRSEHRTFAPEDLQRRWIDHLQAAGLPQ